VAVVAVGQVDTHFLGSLHLETVHGLPCLGNVDLIVVGIAHFGSLLLSFSGKQAAFRKGERLFSFRSPILTKVENSMNVKWRKDWKRMESVHILIIKLNPQRTCQTFRSLSDDVLATLEMRNLSLEAYLNSISQMQNMAEKIFDEASEEMSVLLWQIERNARADLPKIEDILGDAYIKFETNNEGEHEAYLKI